MTESNTTSNRIKWVRAESREEHECERLGWKLIDQETRIDGSLWNSLWCLWAEMVNRPTQQKVQSITEKTNAMTAGEMLLVINDIHLHAIAARLSGDSGSIMLEIERIAEDAIERACNESAGDTEFIIVEDPNG